MPSDETIITKQETTEVIGLNGETGKSEGARSLSSIFDKMIESKADGGTAKDAIAEVAEEKKEAAAEKEVKEEKKVEPAKSPDEVKPEVEDLAKKLDSAQKDKQDASDKKTSDRDALKRLTEVEEKKEVKEEKADPESDIPAEELQVLPYDKPKTAKRITALLGKIKQVESREAETKKEVEAKAKRLSELEEELTKVKTVNPETDEKVKAQLDELAMFRRRYELDKDPEVKTKFDTRIDASEKSIKESLTRRGASKALLDMIDQEGGWSRFSNSSLSISVPDGEGGTRQVAASELADTILNALPLGERKAIEAAMMDQVQTANSKKLFYEEQQGKANEYFKKREEESTKSTEAQKKQIEDARKAVDSWQKQVEASDWIKNKELPEKASESEKKAIAEHNRYNSQLRGLLKKAVNTSDLDGMLEIIQDSVRYYDERRTSASLKRELDSVRAELAAKKNEIDKFKGASRSVPKAGSIASSASVPTEADKRPRTLGEAFDRISAGESVRDND